MINNSTHCIVVHCNRNVNDIANVLIHCFSLLLLWIIIVNSDIDYENNNNNNKERTKADKMMAKNNYEWTKVKNIKQYHQHQDASEVIMIFKYHNDIITSSMSLDKLLFKWHSKYKWVHLRG